MRVAKESIFSGMNNLKTNSILDDSYSEYFGFTTEEVMEMLRYYKKKKSFKRFANGMMGTDLAIQRSSIHGRFRDHKGAL